MGSGKIEYGGDVVGWDRLGRYNQGMVVYLPWVRKRRVRVDL